MSHTTKTQCGTAVFLIVEVDLEVVRFSNGLNVLPSSLLVQEVISLRNTYPVTERPFMCISNHSVLFSPGSATFLGVEQLNADGTKAVATIPFEQSLVLCLKCFSIC